MHLVGYLHEEYVNSADHVHDNLRTNHMQHTYYVKFCNAKLRDLHDQVVR
jgi:hypothetical protein